jgi:hypothetical protein
MSSKRGSSTGAEDVTILAGSRARRRCREQAAGRLADHTESGYMIQPYIDTPKQTQLAVVGNRVVPVSGRVPAHSPPSTRTPPRTGNSDCSNGSDANDHTTVYLHNAQAHTNMGSTRQSPKLHKNQNKLAIDTDPEFDCDCLQEKFEYRYSANRCIPFGHTSPARSASVHPFLRSQARRILPSPVPRLRPSEPATDPRHQRIQLGHHTIPHHTCHQPLA